MIYIDIPQVAYKTIGIEYAVYDKDGNRDRVMEYELEKDMEKALSMYPYSSEHPHVK